MRGGGGGKLAALRVCNATDGGRESEGSGGSSIEIGTGKDAGKRRTGVRTGAGIGNCRFRRIGFSR